MTWEFFRHMKPDRTMIIVLDKGRGAANLARYGAVAGTKPWELASEKNDVYVNYGMDSSIFEENVIRWCVGLDVVYAAETFYGEHVAKIMRRCGVKTVLHAMPELWRGEETMARPDIVWTPTSWEIGSLPVGADIVPVPVDTARFANRGSGIREAPLTFLFTSAPAFHDRNGLLLAQDALAHVQQPCRVVFAGTSEPPPPIVNEHGTAVTIEWRPGGVDNYWDRYTPDIDALLLPRRYAGLSLPMQEAAAAGLPIVTLDLPPQNEWVPATTTAPARLYRQVPMVNGRFWVHTANPAHIAGAMDRLSDPVTYDAAHWASWDHAAEISWDTLEPVYRDKLQALGSDD